MNRGRELLISGATPTEVAATRRVQKAKRLIDETEMPMSEIAHAAGFRSLRRFYDAFWGTYRRPPFSFPVICGYREADPPSPLIKHVPISRRFSLVWAVPCYPQSGDGTLGIGCIAGLLCLGHRLPTILQLKGE